MNELGPVIQMELGRKSLDEMRWEEIWDAALRIRNRFLSSPMSDEFAQAVSRWVIESGADKPLAVRSSAPGEDSAERSFAGLHESFLNVIGPTAVCEAVRLVWASLWSDAALLYRKELSLDPLRSRMAVLVQVMQNQGESWFQGFPRSRRQATSTDRPAGCGRDSQGPCPHRSICQPSGEFPRRGRARLRRYSAHDDSPGSVGVRCCRTPRRDAHPWCHHRTRTGNPMYQRRCQTYGDTR